MDACVDLLRFCIPDLGKCVAGLNDVGPAIQDAIKYLLECHVLKVDEGSGAFHVNPGCFCWMGDLLLVLGVLCCPCCATVVHLRNFEKVTGRTCESECCICCILNCCCLYPCYRAGVRKSLRNKYSIAGSGLEDCVYGCWFMQCAICQEGYELMQKGGLEIPCTSAYYGKRSATVTPSDK